MAMITLEEANGTCKGFNTSKNLVCQILTHAKCFTIDADMASTRSVHTVRNVTVVTSTSCHSTRRQHRDHCHPRQPYHAHNTLLVDQYVARIVTYFQSDRQRANFQNFTYIDVMYRKWSGQILWGCCFQAFFFLVTSFVFFSAGTFLSISNDF